MRSVSCCELVIAAFDERCELVLALGVLCLFALAGLCDLGELALTALGPLDEVALALRQFVLVSFCDPGELAVSVLGELGQLAGALGQRCELAITAFDERCELVLALGVLCLFALAGLCDLGELALTALGPLDEVALALRQLVLVSFCDPGELAVSVLGELGQLAGALGQLCDLAITAFDERCELVLALGRALPVRARGPLRPRRARAHGARPAR